MDDRLRRFIGFAGWVAAFLVAAGAAWKPY